MTIFAATGLGQTPAGYPAYVVDAQQPVVSSDGFNEPKGLTLVAGGTLYVADSGNHRLLEFSPDGTQAAIGFGNLTPAVESPSGLARDGGGNLYVTDVATNRLIKVPAAGTNALAIMKAPLLDDPIAVAADGRGSLLVVNAGNHTVILRYLGGLPGLLPTGGTKLINPRAVAFDEQEQIYVADGGDGVTPAAIYRFPRQGGTGTNLTALGYAAVGYRLREITGMAMDTGGNFYLLDGPGKQLVEIPAGGGQPYLIPETNFNSPNGLATDNLDNLYVSDGGAGKGTGTVTKFVYHNAADFGQVKVGAVSQPVTFNYGFYQPMTVTATHTMGGGRLNAEYAKALGGTCGLKTYEPVTDGNGTLVPAVCTVKVTLKPVFPGGRPGAVQLITSTGTGQKVTAQQLTYGYGLGAQLALLNASITTKLASYGIGAVAVNAAGTEIYFANGNGIYKVPIGSDAPELVTPISGQFALNGAGDLYILTGGAVTIVPADGSTPTILPTQGTYDSQMLVVDPNGAMYVTDDHPTVSYATDYQVLLKGDYTGVILRISPTGVNKRLFPGHFVQPTFLVTDGTGKIYAEDVPQSETFGLQVRTGDYEDPSHLFAGCIPIDNEYGGIFAPQPISMAVDATESFYYVTLGDGDYPAGLDRCGGLFNGPLAYITTPGVQVNDNSPNLPFVPDEGYQALALAPNGNIYYLVNGGLTVVNRSLGLIPSVAFDVKDAGNPYAYPQNFVEVDNIGTEDAHFTGPGVGYTESGTGVGAFRIQSSCVAGAVVEPAGSCAFNVTDLDEPGGGPVLTDTVHLQSDAINNDSVQLKLEAQGPAKPN